MTTTQRGSVLDVLTTFGPLGLTSFGGPTAHLGYFREAVVVRRKWLGDKAYSDLVALCQFLPGPASSQVSMGLGLHRAGLLGMFVSWLTFTVPSAVALAAFAWGLDFVGEQSDAGWLIGLKAATVAVVLHAVWGMAANLTPDARRASLALLAFLSALLLPGFSGQIVAIVGAGALGYFLLAGLPVAKEDSDDNLNFSVPAWLSWAAAVLFVGLLLGLPVVARAVDNVYLTLLDSFYRSGALVFGGGHVVLPLLQAETVNTGLVGADEFLAGYAAAQAVPGPLFTFASFLGAIAAGWQGAMVATVAIFLPSALMLLAALPSWAKLRSLPQARRVLAGVNAGVVGLLAAALYDPVFITGIHGVWTMAVAAIAFIALHMWKTAPWIVVLGAAGLGAVLGAAGAF